MIVETYKSGNIKLEIFRDSDGFGDWRWRIVRCGRIISASSEGYSRRAKLAANLRSIADAVGCFPIHKPSPLAREVIAKSKTT